MKEGKIMKEIDARGLSCPEPLILTKAALKDCEQVKVLVDDRYQKDNVEALVKTLGKKFATSKVSDHYEIVIE
jgi:TusA-related sulfurtransferase